MLTTILSRAAPDVQVKTVRVEQWFTAQMYWVHVEPSHEEYWARFMELYPHWKQAGLRYGLLGFKLTPIFSSRTGVIEWLSDVLGLTRGESNLLQLSVRV
ncbi:hypothetical protein DRN32_01700 [Thermococci archaeon]|nr:MAG: hypothetical protein DRN32_01700 [Thermococci archaeon]